MKIKLFVVSFYFFFLLIIIILVHKNIHLFSDLQLQRFVWLLPYSALVIMQIFSFGLANKAIYGRYMHNGSIINNIRLALANTFGNYLPISVGIISKGIYAKKVSGVPYGTYVVLSIFQVSSVLLISSICSAAVAPLLSIWQIYIFSFGFMIIGFGMLANIYNFLPQRIRHYLTKETYFELRSVGLKSYPLQLMLQGVLHIINSIKLVMIFSVLGTKISIWEVILIYSAISLTRYASITPGGFGIKESIGGAVSKMVGSSFSLSFVAITMDRILDLIITFFVSPIIFAHSNKSRNNG